MLGSFLKKINLFCYLVLLGAFCFGLKILFMWGIHTLFFHNLITYFPIPIEQYQKDMAAGYLDLILILLMFFLPILLWGILYTWKTKGHHHYFWIFIVSGLIYIALLRFIDFSYVMLFFDYHGGFHNPDFVRKYLNTNTFFGNLVEDIILLILLSIGLAIGKKIFKETRIHEQ
jgi:hypothetical protein